MFVKVFHGKHQSSEWLNRWCWLGSFFRLVRTSVLSIRTPFLGSEEMLQRDLCRRISNRTAWLIPNLPQRRRSILQDQKQPPDGLEDALPPGNSVIASPRVAVFYHSIQKWKCHQSVRYLKTLLSSYVQENIASTYCREDSSSGLCRQPSLSCGLQSSSFHEQSVSSQLRISSNSLFLFAFLSRNRTKQFDHRRCSCRW